MNRKDLDAKQRLLVNEANASGPMSLAKYLTLVAAMRDGPGLEQWLLDHGQYGIVEPSPPAREWPATTPQACYENALIAAMQWDDLTYVEGYVMPDHGFPIHHAWLVDSDGRVLDPTLDYQADWVYFGVPLTTEHIVAVSFETGRSGPYTDGLNWPVPDTAIAVSSTNIVQGFSEETPAKFPLKPS